MSLSRSQQMARIKGRDTKPEVLLRKALWARGFRYRVYYKTPVERSDIAVPRRKLAIFVDGCFWHGCPDHYVRPRTRVDFWAGKLSANVARDRRQTVLLEAAGWAVIRLWEHEVFEGLADVVDRIVAGRECSQMASGSMEGWRVEAARPATGPEEDWEERHLVALRDPTVTMIREGRRSTAKWRRPATKHTI